MQCEVTPPVICYNAKLQIEINEIGEENYKHDSIK